MFAALGRLQGTLVLCALLSPMFARAEGLVRLASDDWCPFVCAKDGKIIDGYLVDVTTRAMTLMGFHVEPIFLPLNRAILETITGDVEGVYAPPVHDRLRLSAPIAYSRACFYTRLGERWRYQGLDSLKGSIIGVIDDYGYDDGPMDAYVMSNRKNRHTMEFSFGASAGATNIKKLLRGRYPVLLEHEAVVARLVKALRVDGQLRKAGCLTSSLPLTIGFSARDSRTSIWIRALAEGLKKMDSSGESKALRARYDIPTDNHRKD